MDEPVHFNTDFIYHFGSQHICYFGGEEDGMFDIDTLTWKSKDIPKVLEELQKLKEEYNLPDIKFEKYLKIKDGTNKLQNDLIQLNYPKKYIMGCLIYHQLQYKKKLVATFLTGEPNPNY